MMKYSMSLSTVVVMAAAATAFVPCQTCQNYQSSLSMTAFPEDEYYQESKDSTLSSSAAAAASVLSLPTQVGKKMSESIPFLNCPSVLMNCELAGNVGFDPLGLAKNKELLWEYREAEIKHARLAMLAAIGWPMSEILDRDIADYFQVPAMLDDGDRVPSVLNGGLGLIPPEFWGFCLGLSAAIDMYGLAKARRAAPDYFPGNLGFDPLNFYTDNKLVQERLKLAEIKHGRTAMIGVLGYSIEEYTTKMAVIDDTPVLFQPITETVEDVVLGAIAAEVALGGALVGSF